MEGGIARFGPEEYYWMWAWTWSVIVRGWELIGVSAEERDRGQDKGTERHF